MQAVISVPGKISLLKHEEKDSGTYYWYFPLDVTYTDLLGKHTKLVNFIFDSGSSRSVSLS
jgi:hypothetical protein